MKGIFSFVYQVHLWYVMCDVWCVMCLCDIYCVPVSHFPSDCNLLSIQAPTWRSEQLVISIDWSHGKKMEMVSASICLPDISCLTTVMPPLVNIWHFVRQPMAALPCFLPVCRPPASRRWPHGKLNAWIESQQRGLPCKLWNVIFNKKWLLGFAKLGAIGSISNFVWI